MATVRIRQPKAGIKGKRCCNCGERIDETAPHGLTWVCPHMAGLLDLNGPPWENCRFWTKRLVERKASER
jgi:hypothetical protein